MVSHGLCFHSFCLPGVGNGCRASMEQMLIKALSPPQASVSPVCAADCTSPAIRENTPRKWGCRRSEEGLNPCTVRANREQHSPGAQVTVGIPRMRRGVLAWVLTPFLLTPHTWLCSLGQQGTLGTLGPLDICRGANPPTKSGLLMNRLPGDHDSCA